VRQQKFGLGEIREVEAGSAGLRKNIRSFTVVRKHQAYPKQHERQHNRIAESLRHLERDQEKWSPVFRPDRAISEESRAAKALDGSDDVETALRSVGI
jgi:hypothetical protein